MQRLLDEGMDAGLCGFSIQRLGRNSTQADFDGTPDGDRHDVRRGHPLPRPRCSPPATRASSRSPRRPARSSRTSQFVEQLAAVSGPAGDPQRHRPDPPRPDAAPQVARLAARCWDQGPAGVRPVRHRPVRASCSAWRTGTSTTSPSRGGRSTTGTHDEKLVEDGRPGAARGDGRPRDPQQGPPTASCGPASAARSRTSSCRASPASPSSSSTSGARSADIGQEEGKHPGEVMLDLSLATDLKAEFLGPDKGSNAEFMAELIDVALHAARRLRRRCPHQVLHRRGLDRPTC